MGLERPAKQRSLDLPYSREGPGGFDGTRAILSVYRGIRVANREGRTYPCQIKIGRV
jgi:hypothetical protein